jgi:hypothetical protein
MLNWIKNFFTKPLENQKSLVREQLLNLPLGSYISLTLKPDICEQHIRKQIDRYDNITLTTKHLKGLVKAIYIEEVTQGVYIELVGLVVKDKTAIRKEYVVLEYDILSIYTYE